MITEEQVRQKLPAKFCSKITFGTPDECWNWDCRKGNYGAYWNGEEGKLFRANRVMYDVLFGIPGKLFVLHECDNPSCVNPNHLFLGTAKDNSRDMVNKGRHWNSPQRKNMPREGKNSITLRVVPEKVKHLLIDEQVEMKIKCGCNYSLEKTIYHIIRKWKAIKDYRINGIAVSKLAEELS